MKRILKHLRDNNYYYAKIAIGLAIALLIGAMLFIPLHKTVKKFEEKHNANATVTYTFKSDIIDKAENFAHENFIIANAQVIKHEGTFKKATTETTTEPEETTIETTTEEIIETTEPEIEEVEPEAEPEEVAEYYDDETCGLSDYEFDLLCRIVYAENGADDIPDWVMQYTAEVILNRVKSSSFPNTIEGVVSQPNQYETYWNGMMYNTPSERCKDNVRYALTHEVLPDYIFGQSMSMWEGCIEYCRYVSHYGTEYFFYW